VEESINPGRLAARRIATTESRLNSKTPADEQAAVNHTAHRPERPAAHGLRAAVVASSSQAQQGVAMKIFTRAKCAATTLVMALALGATVRQSQGGKPVPPPPPPVQYTVVWLGTLGGAYNYSSALAANARGEIVGLSASDLATAPRLATRFTPAGPVDLNVEMADLLGARSDGPWRAWIARDINDQGQIAGAITRGLGSHPFIYTPGDEISPRELQILPQIANGITYACGINNRGEIVGLYEGDGGGAFVAADGGAPIDMGPLSFNPSSALINDSGQIAFATGRYTPLAVIGDAGTFEPFPGYLHSINSTGDVAGGYATTTTGKGRTRTSQTVYRASGPGAIQVIYQGTSATFPLINDRRDICFLAGNRITLFRDGYGLIAIDTTLTNADSKWTTANSTVANVLQNPQDVSSFPIIMGQADLESAGSEEAFVLVPSTVP
jgi:hypothetical protein